MQELAIVLSLLAALLVALELGYRGGRRAGMETHAQDGAQIGAIQGALLGLLGLLLAFSFAAAAARFLERQDLIVQEANAIGTTYLRTDLLPEPRRTELRNALHDYAEHRLGVAHAHGGEWLAQAMLEADALHARMWSIAIGGVQDRSELALSLLPPLNDVIDIHSSRVAAAQKHVPPPVMILLLTCSLLAIVVIGYGCGRSGRRMAPLTVPLVLIIGITLWLTIDLDHPRRGLIRLSDAPIESLLSGMK